MVISFALQLRALSPPSLVPILAPPPSPSITPTGPPPPPLLTHHNVRLQGRSTGFHGEGVARVAREGVAEDARLQGEEVIGTTGEEREGGGSTGKGDGVAGTAGEGGEGGGSGGRGVGFGF
ncbi:hypothetical protein LIER_40585 [Lithospermum erythrorhizon]|uniref:Uncharacterized protein n=1 Tax=Lithospermum erythrorhizon TaxID=34254 RepID=A0AAV3R2A7_LITER